MHPCFKGRSFCFITGFQISFSSCSNCHIFSLVQIYLGLFFLRCLPFFPLLVEHTQLVLCLSTYSKMPLFVWSILVDFKIFRAVFWFFPLVYHWYAKRPLVNRKVTWTPVTYQANISFCVNRNLCLGDHILRSSDPRCFLCSCSLENPDNLKPPELNEMESRYVLGAC